MSYVVITTKDNSNTHELYLVTDANGNVIGPPFSSKDIAQGFARALNRQADAKKRQIVIDSVNHAYQAAMKLADDGFEDAALFVSRAKTKTPSPSSNL